MARLYRSPISSLFFQQSRFHFTQNTNKTINSEMNNNESSVHKMVKSDNNHLADIKCDSSFKFTEGLTLETLRQMQVDFINKRNWDQFHSPRNVLLALVGEVGELAEIFQWKGEVTEGVPELTDKEKKHLGQEMSDILLYLVDLANKCHVDLPSAVLEKMEHNGKKYPEDKAYGRADKYTELSTTE